jgi:hypothetical protein
VVVLLSLSWSFEDDVLRLLLDFLSTLSIVLGMSFFHASLGQA